MVQVIVLYGFIRCFQSGNGRTTKLITPVWVQSQAHLYEISGSYKKFYKLTKNTPLLCQESQKNICVTSEMKTGNCLVGWDAWQC